MTAKATDSAGNPPSPASTALLVTVDNLSPDAPTDLKLLTTDDTGSSSTDNITNKTRVTITGKAEANSFVELFNHGTSLGAAVTTDSDGNFSKVVTLPENATANITAKATDIAGNPPSLDSTALSVTVDTTPPNTPTDFKLSAADDTGNNNTDNTTNKTSVTITGKAEANSFVELFKQGILLGTTTADNEGNFSKLVVDLAENTETSITAKATDIAGNTSPSAELKITVDTIAPTVASKIHNSIAPSSDLTITFHEDIAEGNGSIIVRNKSDGSQFEEVIIGTNATIIDKTLTIKLANTLIQDQHYYIEIEAGALEDIAGNDFAGISGTEGWKFKVANLSTTVEWSGIGVDGTDGYINKDELKAANISGKVTNVDNVPNLQIDKIQFSASDGTKVTIPTANLPTIDTNDEWTLVNNTSWTNQLISGESYTIKVELSGILSEQSVKGEGDHSAVKLDTEITLPPGGTVAISEDTGNSNIERADRITSDKDVMVTLNLTSNLTLKTLDGEKLQVSADVGAHWIEATGSDKVWATADNAVTLSEGAGNIIARIIDTAGNISTLTLTDSNYRLDTEITLPPGGTVAISEDTGNSNIERADRITSDKDVMVTLNLTSNLTLKTLDGEKLQVSADVGAHWIEATGSDKVWATADNAVTLSEGAGNIIARIIDTAGNISTLTLTDSNYRLDTEITLPPGGTVAISEDT
ncbi:MAG: hypothetical protein FE834_06345, partial [Gammaproteobacteria bacterium]|nr:hypothetical protein [Gammaproteobacteria bacterium]